MSDRKSARASAVFLVAAIVAYGSIAAAAYGQEPSGATIRAVSSIDMIEGAALLDGATVVFSGEAIGQALARGSMAWVNVGDSGGAIGAWMDADAAASIGTFGAYSFRGDELRVTGTFHRACGEHGGDMDIHAELVEVLRPGERIDHPIVASRLAMAAGLSLAAASSLLALRVRDKKRRDAESRRLRPGNGGNRGT
ncbi:MAG: hypothetical protein A2Y38_11195 [Spirochaetes bacterium GWB1_59_5]|nr:MAG: hypothetical protein A2Y38_11195 [Spirochaetes bacterium GWB1_59_5]